MAGDRSPAGRIVLALGGNALIPAGQAGTWDEQLAITGATMDQVAKLAAAGHRVVLTHGNVVDGHQRIADEFVEKTIVFENDFNHAVEIFVEQIDHVLWRETFTQRSETADIGE